MLDILFRLQEFKWYTFVGLLAQRKWEWSYFKYEKLWSSPICANNILYMWRITLNLKKDMFISVEYNLPQNEN